MDFARARQRLAGCYITIPTMFQDPELELDLPAIRRHVHWLVGRGIDARYGTFLAGGAAGDFSTMTFDERVRVAETVVEAADGARAGRDGRPDHVHAGAAPAGQGGERRWAAEYIQVSCPFYFTAHRGGLLRACLRGGRRRRHRHHPLQHLLDLGRRLVRPGRAAGRASAGVVGLKWACPRTDAMEFEDVVAHLLRPADASSTTT